MKTSHWRLWQVRTGHHKMAAFNTDRQFKQVYGIDSCPLGMVKEFKPKEAL